MWSCWLAQGMIGEDDGQSEANEAETWKVMCQCAPFYDQSSMHAAQNTESFYRALSRNSQSFYRVLAGNRLCPVLCVVVDGLIMTEQTPVYVTHTDIQC